ncbi:hypothetical protein EYR40_006588 [Pleurotus pulmonarius]|nr:hypothetical protein EYR36_011209 [Pleurotus pulmonarius]KAF4599494.1 hypothetical protein EYR40_006588 [Pleurotus pulmonarius]
MSHTKLLPEMLPHQRALIDTSFEEGQYESGLIAFDQLRVAAKCYPSPALVSQVLYLALYTPPPNEQKVTEPGSPSKMASRQQRLAHMPTQAASFAAQRLLMSLITSTPPDILLRGLPSYSAPGATVLNEEADSYVAKEARCIRQAKDCWSILKEGFIHEATAPPITTRWQRRGSRDDLDAAHAQPPLIVAENAWPVLEWLIRLFQEDELRHSGYSPLLLSEIPLPRDNTGARWETDAALDIVFYSLSQTSERRRHCGIQLLTMLIRLWAARHLDTHMFIASVYKRVSTCQEVQLLALLDNLGAVPSTMEFRIIICQKLLSDMSLESSSRGRPRPQARTQPRAVRGAQSSQTIIDAPSTPVAGPSSNISPSGSMPFILQLLRDESYTTTEERPKSLIAHVKFHLLMAYGAYQYGLKPADVSWAQALRSGEILDAINNVFDRLGDAKALGDTLKVHVSQWITVI